MKLNKKKINKNYTKKKNSHPGKFVFTGEKKSEDVDIQLIEYNDKKYNKMPVNNIEHLKSLDNECVKWININGLHNIEIIENIGKVFSIHPLTLEDILNTVQRPKMEVYEKYIYFVMRMVYIKNGVTVNEQFSLVLGNDFVISFQEIKGDVFEKIRERIKSLKYKISKECSDYLAYCLIDSIIDNYFEVIEELGENINELEEKVLTTTSQNILNDIHNLRNKIIFLKKAIWPIREMIKNFGKTEMSLVKETTKIYINDIYDHSIHIIEHLDHYREIISGLRDTFLSNLSNKMNEIMKTLTIIATIFIPLTFIAGIYGMNFENMPELKWHFGYYMVWGVNILIIIFLFVYFKIRKWL